MRWKAEGVAGVAPGCIASPSSDTAVLAERKPNASAEAAEPVQAAAREVASGRVRSQEERRWPAGAGRPGTFCMKPTTPGGPDPHALSATTKSGFSNHRKRLQQPQKAVATAMKILEATAPTLCRLPCELVFLGFRQLQVQLHSYAAADCCGLPRTAADCCGLLPELARVAVAASQRVLRSPDGYGVWS